MDYRKDAKIFMAALRGVTENGKGDGLVEGDNEIDLCAWK